MKNVGLEEAREKGEMRGGAAEPAMGAVPPPTRSWGSRGVSVLLSYLCSVPQLTHINIVGKIWKRNRKLIGRGAAVCAPFPHFGALGGGGNVTYGIVAIGGPWEDKIEVRMGRGGRR